jgi:hypothetical protein
MVLSGKTPAQWHHVAGVAPAFWPRRRCNRRWPVHEIVQQPVKPFRLISANMLQMPDSIGFCQFIAFLFKWATWPQNIWKSVLHSTAH